MTISTDEMSYVEEIIENAVPKDLQTLVDLNNRVYLKVEEISAEYRRFFKPGDPVIVSIHGESLFGRMTKVNPKTFKVKITDSQTNPSEMRGKLVSVNHFQVKKAEKVS